MYIYAYVHIVCVCVYICICIYTYCIQVCAELPGTRQRCPGSAAPVIYNDERWFSHSNNACVTPAQWNHCIAALPADEAASGGEGMMECWDRIFASEAPKACFGMVRHDVMWTLVGASDVPSVGRDQSAASSPQESIQSVQGSSRVQDSLAREETPAETSLSGRHQAQLTAAGPGRLKGILSVQTLVHRVYSYARSSQKSNRKSHG